MIKKTGIISFTDRGDLLNTKLSGLLRDRGYEVKSALRGEASLSEWTGDAFKGDAVIFIGAAGIAVRAIAPFIESKDKDPAVIVSDEYGSSIIPVLSGHLGGGNRFASEIASLTGGRAVITTATDLNGVWAADTWAAEKGFKVENTGKIKTVSGALLSGERVGVSVSPFLRDIFPETLHIVPKCLCLGIGCKRNTDYEVLREFIMNFLDENNIAFSAISDIATIDIKKNEEAVDRFSREYNLPVSFYSAEELNDISGRFSFEVSDFVEEKTGCDNVCERSAIKKALEYCGENEAEILVKKTRGKGVTASLAVYGCDRSKDGNRPKIYVIGTGPGNPGAMTQDAVRAIKESSVITGYRPYLEYIRDLIRDKEVIGSGMREEVKRCRLAREKALGGRTTAVICSGDAGVYGMAGLIYEVCSDCPQIDIEVIPGITAALSGAALLGAPLMNDFVCISLSDILTGEEVIRKRLEAAAEADLVTVLYNPGSRKRPDNLKKACDIMLKKRPGDTVCGYVINAGRKGQETGYLSLSELRERRFDMFATVFIGNSMTRLIGEKMVTDRGYGITGP